MKTKSFSLFALNLLSSALAMRNIMASFPIFKLLFCILLMNNLSKTILAKPGYNIDIKINVRKDAIKFKVQPESASGFVKNAKGN